MSKLGTETDVQTAAAERAMRLHFSISMLMSIFSVSRAMLIDPWRGDYTLVACNPKSQLQTNMPHLS